MDAELRELCERLRGLLAKATPGPWHRQSECPDECCWHLFRKVPDGIANTASESMADGYDGSLINNPEMTGENSALIVAAVNALPRLLDTIAAQAAELEGVRKLCRDMLPVFQAARPLVLNLERLKDAAAIADSGAGGGE